MADWPIQRPSAHSHIGLQRTGFPKIDIWKFESSQPSHTVLLFWRVGRLYGKVPTFRALARTGSVFGAY
jgi:hypothetical protein